jgi:hypothetical protein
MSMKNAMFWDVMPCGCCENQRFGGTYCLQHQHNKNQLALTVRRNLQLKHAARKYCVFVFVFVCVCVCVRACARAHVNANVPGSLILVTLVMEMIYSSETSVLTRAIWHNIPEDGILQHSHIILCNESILHACLFSPCAD